MASDNGARANKGAAKQLVGSTAKTLQQKNDQDKLSEDFSIIKDGFSWKTVAGFYIPCITRLVNGEHLLFVSTRMAEHVLLKKYLHNVHADIYTSCTSVKGFVITDLEAKILNYINDKHYRKDFKYFAGIDYVIRLEDFDSFYIFLEVCYSKLLCNNTSGHKDKCGFIFVDTESILPYCTMGGQKYVPIFFFEGETENLLETALKLENWNLAYLKFCCKILGIKDQWFDSDSWLVVSLDQIKSFYPPETDFKDFWSSQLSASYIFDYHKSKQENRPRPWFKISRDVVTDENTIHHILTAPAPEIPQSTEVMMNQMLQQENQQQQQQQQQINTTTPLVQAHDNSKNSAYKVQLATLEGKTIHCINAKPYIYSDLMVTLKDLVRIMLPSCNVAKCAHILHECLKTTLLFGKSEQLAVLLENGLIKSMIPGDTPMAMLQDITQVLPQLKVLVLIQDEAIKKI